VIFQLAARAKDDVPWNETLIHTFTGGSDGSGTETGLVPDQSGDFYGTSTGGPSRGGLLFRLEAANARSWSLDVLYDFTGAPDGYGPASLVRAKTGALYGATLYGGTGQACSGGCGTVFRAEP
jgi:hypothetical protein